MLILIHKINIVLMMMNVQNKHLQIKMTKIIVLNLVNILKHINMNNNVLYIVLKI